MKITMIGPQGSGKGTQAHMLAEKYDIPHISTGDIFRENMKNDTELGKEAKKYINQGKLVPDSVTIDMILERLKKPDCKNGFLLDGFPRNLEQAETLEKNAPVDCALEVDIKDKTAVERISSRRTCKECGSVYSTIIDGVSDKCPKCGGELMIREDDTPDAVRERLLTYHSQTRHVLDFYKERSKLISIDGEQPVKDVFDEIKRKLDEMREKNKS